VQTETPTAHIHTRSEDPFILSVSELRLSITYVTNQQYPH